MEDSNGTFKVIGALVVGALTGAALGILFAPAKGSRTRRNIANGARDLTEDLKDRMTSEAASLRKKAQDLEEMARDKVDEVFESVKNKAEQATKSNK